MYYLEIRFNTKNEKVVKLFMNNYKNHIEIISSYIDDYYICYHLKHSIKAEILSEIKNHKLIYFFTYYGQNSN